MSLHDVYWTSRQRVKRRNRSLMADVVVDLLIAAVLLASGFVPLMVLGGAWAVLGFIEFVTYLWLKAHRPRQERPADPHTKIDWHRMKFP